MAILKKRRHFQLDARSAASLLLKPLTLLSADGTFLFNLRRRVRGFATIFGIGFVTLKCWVRTRENVG